jgi:hypothetical protein
MTIEQNRLTVSTTAAGLFFAYFFLWISPALGAPPANDNFENRQAIAGTLPVEVTGSNVGATAQAGESLQAPSTAGHSVWFKWEAPAGGWTTIGSCNGAMHPVVAIFEGTALDSLYKVARTGAVDHSSEGPHCATTESEFTFMAKEGTTYVIAVDGNTNPSIEPPLTEGAFPLRIEPTPPPPNDDFQNATPLERVISEFDPPNFYRAPAFGYNWGATKESGEPDHADDPGGASVWYSWTAPLSGVAEIYLCCSFSDQEFGFYTGDSVDALTPVLETGFSTFPVTAGQTYHLAVDGRHDFGEGGPWMGSFSLSIGMSLTPASSTVQILPSPPYVQASDAGAPRTTIVKRKLMPHVRGAAFRFRSNVQGGGFLCRLDGHPSSPCRSPKTYSQLHPGRHTFEVVALDAAGIRDPTPAIAKFQLPNGNGGPSNR